MLQEAHSIRAIEPDEGKFSGQITAAAGATTTWDAQLFQGREIVGKLVDERGQPLVGWTVGTRTTTELWERRTQTEEDGSFSLADVQADAREVAVMGLRNQRTGVLLTKSIEEGPMLIRVPDNLRPSSSVSLQVLCAGKAPPKPARVVVTTEGYGRKELYTDGSGLVRIDSLRAGIAELEISAKGFASAHLMADLQPDEVKELPAVSLTRGGQLRVRFTLPGDEDPAELPQQITVYNMDGQFVNFTGLRDGQGTTGPIAPGTYSVRLHSGGWPEQPLQVTVEDGVVTEIELELKPHGAASLVLVNGDGAQYSGRVRYRVVSEAGTTVIPWTRQTKRPLGGMTRTTLGFSGLPQGSFTAEVEGERGARAEARFSITQTGFGYSIPEG